MNTKNSIKRRLIAARAVLVLDHPFFGALSLRMNYRGGNERAHAHHGNRWAEHLLSQGLREGML